MKFKQVLFIQGGGNDGYEADKELVLSLSKDLGQDYRIDYPRIQSDETFPDFGWTKQIGEAIHGIKDDLILVGHSFGASMILKYFSENSVNKTIEGIFLLATPFWGADEEWQAGLQLKAGFADKLPAKVPIFFYHCRDDEEVPFSHLSQYKKGLAQANFREIETGGHQFNNSLTWLAEDIKSL